MHRLDDFLDDPNTYRCPECNGSASVRAYGGPCIGVRCDDYECDGYHTGATLVRDRNESGVVFEAPDTRWVNGSPERIRYRCPECDTTDIDRIPYDDGCGFYDVRVACNNCGADTWE